jgi:hypothetical protein
MRILAALFLLAVIFGVVLSCCASAAWVGITAERLSDLRVGDPVAPPADPNKCCKYGNYIPCDPECVTNPVCNSEAEINDDCGAAACADVDDPLSKCSDPATVYWRVYNTCYLTGGSQACSGGGRKCYYVYFPYDIGFVSCNPAQTACATQPPVPCN